LLLLSDPEAFEWAVYGKAVLLDLGFDGLAAIVSRE
jgi:hypothetical protein